jgi:CTP-dependent riboflavin kinase
LHGQRKINGVVFSDLGQASLFMALDWVQHALQQRLGFAPFPATLNMRPETREDLQAWEAVRSELEGIPLESSVGGFCSARLFRVEIHNPVDARQATTKGAVLLPEVRGYPKNKIEIVAAVRLKDELGVEDGDQLTLEFVN